MWQVQESLLLRCEMPGRKGILVGSEVDKTVDKSCKQIYCPCACAQKADWAMHKLECSAMNVFGEKWCPSEITRLVARILTKKVSHRPQTSSDYSVAPSGVRLFMVPVSHRKCRRTDVFVRSCCSSERCSRVSSCFRGQAGILLPPPNSSS